MKKGLVLMMGLLAILIAVPAMADVDLLVEVTKDKYIDVDEKTTIDNDVDVDVDVNVDPAEAAQSKALVNQKIENNFEFQTDPDQFRYNFKGSDTQDSVSGSVNQNSGIVGVNQSSGNLNNQGNAASVSVVGGTDPASPKATIMGGFHLPPYPREEDGTFADAQAVSDQKINKSGLITFDTSASAVIENSINANTGVVGVNQAPGNLNNQSNAVAIAAGLDGADVALAESDLGQVVGCNTLIQVDYKNTNKLSASINQNSGIVGVNQSAGNFNNQSNVVTVSAAPF